MGLAQDARITIGLGFQRRVTEGKAYHIVRLSQLADAIDRWVIY